MRQIFFFIISFVFSSFLYIILVNHTLFFPHHYHYSGLNVPVVDKGLVSELNTPFLTCYFMLIFNFTLVSRLRAGYFQANGY